MRKKSVILASMLILITGFTSSCGDGSNSTDPVSLGLNPAFDNCSFDLETIMNGPSKFKSTTKWYCSFNDYNGDTSHLFYAIYGDGTGEESNDGVIVTAPFTWTQTQCNSFKSINFNGTTEITVLGGSQASGIFSFEANSGSESKNVTCQLYKQ